MKVYAMYLPQFHRVKENDEWWGEGFTDWVSTKNALPLFEGHYQPHIPLNENYYDLSKKNVMQWQANLMHKYGVDGMCIYHYWFKDGRQILEKPAENLLQWKDIDMPYCFYWANESWARSWSNIKEKNVWSNLEEKNNTQNGNGILLEQSYGEEKDWRQHFEYLKDFFMDDRYLKIDGKPVFIIYKVNSIGCISEMADSFNKWAKEVGFPGVYFIGSRCDREQLSVMDAELIHEPLTANKVFLEKRYDDGIRRLDYNAVWNEILNNEVSGKKVYYSGFVGYDDSPRRGIEGVVIDGMTPERFRENLTKLLAKNEREGSEITFINAWNEWGEGMHLEPDEKYETSFLEQISKAKEEYRNVSISDVKSDNFKSQIKKYKDRSDKFEQYMHCMDNWLSILENNISVSAELKKMGYRNIGIYGYGILGKHLLDELGQESQIEVCLIDMQAKKLHTKYLQYEPCDKLPQLDVIIVAASFYYEDVQRQMGEKQHLISIDNLLKKIIEKNKI